MTSPSDHDRALERLLRGLSGSDAPVTSSCLDFEQLAAWSEGAIAPAERRAIEDHLGSCGRCQELVAVFAQAAPAKVPAARPFWRRPFVRWVVPLTAAAAATIIWMVRPDDRDPATFAPSTSMARLEPSAEPSRDAVPPRQSERETRQKAEAQNRASVPPARDDDKAADEKRPADTSSTAVTAPVEKAREEADRSAARTEQEMLSRFSAQASTLVILSPDPDRRWRLTNSIVQRSNDGGATWQPVTLPPGSVPTAGVSPARDVCWLIGSAGLVLRTTDGTRFESFNIPGAGDLRTIEATDANRAIVTTTAGRAFTTTDGGRTWN